MVVQRVGSGDFSARPSLSTEGGQDHTFETLPAGSTVTSTRSIAVVLVEPGGYSMLARRSFEERPELTVWAPEVPGPIAVPETP